MRVDRLPYNGWNMANLLSSSQRKDRKQAAAVRESDDPWKTRSGSLATSALIEYVAGLRQLPEVIYEELLFLSQTELGAVVCKKHSQGIEKVERALLDIANGIMMSEDNFSMIGGVIDLDQSERGNIPMQNLRDLVRRSIEEYADGHSVLAAPAYLLGWAAFCKFLRKLFERGVDCRDPTGAHRIKVLMCLSLARGDDRKTALEMLSYAVPPIGGTSKIPPGRVRYDESEDLRLSEGLRLRRIWNELHGRLVGNVERPKDHFLTGSVYVGSGAAAAALSSGATSKPGRKGGRVTKRKAHAMPITVS